uniref:Uncharacterized protein n=1 Tax=Urocitellus parryii TaxID=9999 RepID=A0A8D2I307_UROPR
IPGPCAKEKTQLTQKAKLTEQAEQAKHYDETTTYMKAVTEQGMSCPMRSAMALGGLQKRVQGATGPPGGSSRALSRRLTPPRSCSLLRAIRRKWSQS